MPNRPGYRPRDARLDLSERKQLQDALCRKALLARDERDHRRNTKIKEEWPEDERINNEPWHGKLAGYTHHGCRCKRCSGKMGAYKRELNKKKQQA